MPRTKRPARTQEKTGVKEKDDVLKKLDKIVAEQKANIDARVHMECRNVDLAFKMLLGQISNIHLNKTVGQLKNELHIKEIANSTRKTRNSSRAASHDDGYLTETSQGSAERIKKPMGPPPSTGRAARSRSASASASGRKPPAPSSAAAKQSKRRSRSVYRTPAYNKMAQHNYPAITPKVAPHTPLTVLRRPRQGEMVVSMSGSPLMSSVCNMASEDKAHCNIMLQDGTMLSLQPKQLRESQAFIPFSLMDSAVLRQLKTLKDNLAKVVKMGENVMKS